MARLHSAVMATVSLTNEQKRAATAPTPRLFIEATPGSGKTTVAAARFGIARFASISDEPTIVAALSFTRSATSELLRRIKDRWGPSAASWPHRVVTIDSLVCDILHFLLRRGLIVWPKHHTRLEVIDDWRGHRGYRDLDAGKFRRVATIVNRVVRSTTKRVHSPTPGFSTKQDFERQLECGRCTHAEVRDVLFEAIQVDMCRVAVERFLQSSIGHMIVDEVYDANDLDLKVVELAIDAEIDVTLIGDPWQALYGFRGARPDLVSDLMKRRRFHSYPLSDSFRFSTDKMKTLSLSLKKGRPVTVQFGTEYDVVLASTWNALWNGPDRVLPVSFGQHKNRIEAASILLLDYPVRSRLVMSTAFLEEALILLGIDTEVYEARRIDILEQVAGTLMKKGCKEALDELRDATKELGADRRPQVSGEASESRQIARLEKLAVRLNISAPLVPGLTIHQAKGREWNRVGIILARGELYRIGRGLCQESESDRKLYVAFTRARQEVVQVAHSSRQAQEAVAAGL